MFLPDIIITAYNEGFSGVYVQCTKPAVVAEEFSKLFHDAYIKAMNNLEDHEGVFVSEKYYDLFSPATVELLNDAQFLIRLAPLYLTLNDGSRVDNDYLLNALVETLGLLMDKFPNVSYHGLISYEWFDEHCGDVVSVEICSGKTMTEDTIYPFVKTTFDKIFADEELSEEFWERIEDNLYDCTEEDIESVIECLKLYEQPNTVLERFQEIATECINED